MNWKPPPGLTLDPLLLLLLVRHANFEPFLRRFDEEETFFGLIL